MIVWRRDFWIERWTVKAATNTATLHSAPAMHLLACGPHLGER